MLKETGRNRETGRQGKQENDEKGERIDRKR